MPRDQPGDERQQRPKVGREIDVRVAENVRVTARPGRAERPAAPLGAEMDDVHVGEFVRECSSDRERRIRARVVGDHDPPGERHLLG